jgi:lipopolysaccharide heptosyltransferase I
MNSAMTPGPSTLLLVKPSSLGDIIHTLPVLDALHRSWPATAIDWIVKPEWAPLLEGHPMLRDVLRVPLRVGAWPSLAAELRRRRYEMVIDLQGLLRSGLLSWLTRAPVRVGFANGREGSPWFYNRRITPPPEPVHAVERYRDLVRQLGVETAGAVRFPLPAWPTARTWAERFWADERIGPEQPVCVLHPAARWVTKRWPAERFASVAQRLMAQGWRVILVAAVAQQALAAAVGRLAQGRVIDLAGRTTLPQLAALLGRASVLVTNDSGPMHLAAAVGTPVVAMFGPTDPRKIGPYGSGHAVLFKGIDCSPCHRQRCVQDGACLNAISVDAVVEAVDRTAASNIFHGGAYAH